MRLSGISILIAKFFSTSTLGQFSLAWKMVQTPMSLIGSSLSQVFFQKVSSVDKADLYVIVKQFIKKAILVSLPMFLVIYFFAEDIFIVVFGEDWRIAGKAASVMTPWLFLNFITSPLSTLFIVLNKQDIMLLFAFFYMLIPLSLIYLLRNNSFIEVLNSVSISMTFLLLVFIGLVLFYSRKAT
jgi:O-antigen/teichoic acid export membrane protein